MLRIRLITGFLLLFAFLCIAAEGMCAEKDIDWQIAERTQQYYASLRQRAAQLSPSLQAKIESQARRTVAKGTTAWKKGEVSLQIALPRLAESRRGVMCITRHLPFSSSPTGSFEFEIGIAGAALMVTTVQSVGKSFPVSTATFVTVCSLAAISCQQRSAGISYFAGIAAIIVLRR